MQTHTTRLKHTRKLVANRLGGAGGRIYISQVWNNKRRAEPTYPPAGSLEFGVSIVGHCRWISKARTNMRTRNVVYVGGQWVCMCVCCVWCLILCGSSSSGSQVKRAVKTTTGILSWTSFSQSASVGNCEAIRGWCWTCCYCDIQTKHTEGLAGRNDEIVRRWQEEENLIKTVCGARVWPLLPYAYCIWVPHMCEVQMRVSFFGTLTGHHPSQLCSNNGPLCFRHSDSRRFGAGARSCLFIFKAILTNWITNSKGYVVRIIKKGVRKKSYSIINTRTREIGAQTH